MSKHKPISRTLTRRADHKKHDSSSSSDDENETRPIVYRATNPGPTGPRGEQGKSGKGFIGNAGPRGEKGDKGDKGDPGDRGIQGLSGKPGPRGFPGPQGKDGPEGAIGPDGPQGIRGQRVAAGNGPPTTWDDCIDGDIYIDIYSGIVYQFQDPNLNGPLNPEDREFEYEGSLPIEDVNTIAAENDTSVLIGKDLEFSPFVVIGNLGYVNNEFDGSGNGGGNGCSGNRGPCIFTGPALPTNLSIYMNNDLFFDTTTNNLYRFDLPTMTFILIGSLGMNLSDIGTFYITFDAFNTGNTTDIINNYYFTTCKFTTILPTSLIICDSTSPGTDVGLGSPNQDFGGQGIGIGGKQGRPGENNMALGKLLILDNGTTGGLINIIFNKDIIATHIKVINGDNNQIIIKTYDSTDTLISIYDCPILNQNSVYVQQLCDNKVRKISVESIGKFGLHSVEYKTSLIDEEEMSNNSKYFLAHNTTEIDVPLNGISVPWNKPEVSTPFYTYNNDEIVFNEDGYYKIFVDLVIYQTFVSQSQINSCEAFIVKKNQFTNNYYFLDGTRTTMNLTDLLHGYASSGIHTIKKIKKGDIIKVNIVKNGPNTNIKTYSHGCRILIENLNY